MIKLLDILFENNGCCSRPKAPILLENAGKTLISDHLQYHIQNKLPLTENTFRYGSKSFISLWNEARELHKKGIILLEGDDKAIVEETDLGKFAKHNGVIVPLDLILEYESEELILEADKKKNKPLNKPKRGGSKKFYVYVRDPKTKNIKKVSFGAPGMSVGFKDPKRRKAFAARHKCSQAKDRTSARYWSCNIGRYAKSLGLGNNFYGFW
jgi:signal peptidase I